VEQRRTRIFRLRSDIAVESHRAANSESTLNDLVETDKGSATYEKDMCRIDLRELLMGMFSASLRRNVGDRSFEHFQQCLLNAFPRNIRCDGWILVLPADFIDFINVDNSRLRALNITAGILDQPEDDIFHILADIARLSQRCCIHDR